MEDCCRVDPSASAAPARCPVCGEPGRRVARTTLEALLHPSAAERLSAPEHRFCPTAGCPVVYFGAGERFDREDVAVPVFQKQPAGDRTVCYCFGITERDIRREADECGRSTAADRITALVKAGRCACEVKNPQGRCCLGNVVALASGAAAPASGSGSS